MGTYLLNITFASMLIKYSDNLFMQIIGVIYHNRNRLIAFTIIAAMAVGAGGALKDLKTTVLIPMDEAVEAMRKAGGVGYRPPGG